MEFRSKLTSRLSMGILAVGFFLACGGKSLAQDLEPSTSDQELKQRLLAEILDGNGSDRPVHKGQADKSDITGKKNTKKNHEADASEKQAVSMNEVGTSVASVPTWPVMILVVFMAGILLWLKKGGKLGHSQVNSINKLAVVPLGGKRSLALVEVLGQKLVLGMSEKGLSLLTKIDVADAAMHQDRQEPELESYDDPFEQELRDILGSESIGDDDGLPASVERVDLARKFRHLRNG